MKIEEQTRRESRQENRLQLYQVYTYIIAWGATSAADIGHCIMQ
jgi:hypothetical protein